MANGSIKNMLREMTEEELNKIITATYDGAWRGARDAVNVAIVAIVEAVIFIGFLIWLFWYGGFPIVAKLIYVIAVMLSAMFSATPCDARGGRFPSVDCNIRESIEWGPRGVLLSDGLYGL